MKVCSTRGWFNVPQGYVEIKTTNGDVVVPRSIQENLYQHLLSVKEKLNGEAKQLIKLYDFLIWWISCSLLRG